MLTFITAMAAAAAAQAAPPAAAANPPAQHMQMQGMDMSKMDHSKMDHSAMAKHGDGCCKQTADGKMECSMPNKGAGSAPQGHSGQ